VRVQQPSTEGVQGRDGCLRTLLRNPITGIGGTFGYTQKKPINKGFMRCAEIKLHTRLYRFACLLPPGQAVMTTPNAGMTVGGSQNGWTFPAINRAGRGRGFRKPTDVYLG
jgi:hypothetical protein